MQNMPPKSYHSQTDETNQYELKKCIFETDSYCCLRLLGHLFQE